MECKKCNKRLRRKKTNFLVGTKFENYMVTMNCYKCPTCKETIIPKEERMKAKQEIDQQIKFYKKNKRKINAAIKESAKNERRKNNH